MATPGPLHAREIGSGHPILFIHGWEMNGAVEALDFEPIFTHHKAPFQNFRRIYVDLPGMGGSPPHGIQNLDDIFHRLTQFIDSNLAGSRFLLVGSSCGAYLARAVARRYANQIDGLMLRVPLMEPEDVKRDVDAFEPLVRVEGMMDGLGVKVKAMLGNVLVQTEAYVTALGEKYRKAYLPALESADKEVLSGIRRDPSRYRLSKEIMGQVEEKLMAPTLIVCGRQDDVVGYRDSLRLLEEYPRAAFVVLDRAGHNLPVDDRGGVFDALVQDWLLRIDEWRGPHNG